MITKIKLYAILGVLVVAIGLFVAKYLNNHSFVSDELIESKDKRIVESEKKIISLDSTVFSTTQNLDICKANDKKYQIVIAELKKRSSEALTAEKRATEAIEHYEKNGLMRYFVFDPKGIFKKGCFQELDKKPENICK